MSHPDPRRPPPAQPKPGTRQQLDAYSALPPELPPGVPPGMPPRTLTPEMFPPEALPPGSLPPGMLPPDMLPTANGGMLPAGMNVPGMPPPAGHQPIPPTQPQAIWPGPAAGPLPPHLTPPSTGGGNYPPAALTLPSGAPPLPWPSPAAQPPPPPLAVPQTPPAASPPPSPPAATPGSPLKPAAAAPAKPTTPGSASGTPPLKSANQKTPSANRPASPTAPSKPSPSAQPNVPSTAPTAPAVAKPARQPNMPAEKQGPLPQVRTAIPTPTPSIVAGPKIATENIEGEKPLDVTAVAARTAPPWLVSMVVHLLLVVALALVHFPELLRPVLILEASYADDLGEQMLDDTVTTLALDVTQATEAVLSEDLNPVEDPLASLPEMPIALQGATAVNLNAPSIGIALSGREKGAKRALLAAYGGTAETESAVGMALEWLRRNQQRDGSWSLTGPYANATTVENRTAATAMALLALQGAGNTHRAGEYQESVQKGMTALLKMQDSDGLFFHEGISNHRLYSQAMATIAICELYGMTQDEKLKEPTLRALNYAAKIQADDGKGGGGWRYQPGMDVDTSVTGWFVMAYQSARMAGLESYSPVLSRVSAYLDHVERLHPDESSGQFAGIEYFYRLDEIPDPPKAISGLEMKRKPPPVEATAMTAEALLCRQYLGWDRNDPRMRAGVQLILKKPIDWDEPSFYYWYYATQVLHHFGGDEWFDWNQTLRKELPVAQVKNGKERGSWSPDGDHHGYQGGRMYSTCFCTYMLEVYYRHLPIYRH